MSNKNLCHSEPHRLLPDNFNAADMLDLLESPRGDASYCVDYYASTQELRIYEDTLPSDTRAIYAYGLARIGQGARVDLLHEYDSTRSVWCKVGTARTYSQTSRKGIKKLKDRATFMLKVYRTDGLAKGFSAFPKVLTREKAIAKIEGLSPQHRTEYNYETGAILVYRFGEYVGSFEPVAMRQDRNHYFV